MCTHKSQTVIVLKQKLYVHPNLAIFIRITPLNFKNDHDATIGVEFGSKKIQASG